MSARKGEPVPVAPKVLEGYHVFAPNPYGARDPLTGLPIECLVVIRGKRCKFPKANGVHKSSEELAESLPPVPEEDISKRIIGEAG